jgi:hypothetical protein
VRSYRASTEEQVAEFDTWVYKLHISTRDIEAEREEAFI